MSVIEELHKAKNARFISEDDEPLTPVFLPALNVDRLEKLEEDLGAPLPADLRELAGECGGIEGLLDSVSFEGGLAFEMPEIFPKGLPIAGDGFGNFWVIDVLSAPEACARIFFACHDAPVILFQCSGMADFLAELVKMHVPPHRSLLDDVNQDRLYNVWKTNPGTIDQVAALQSPDPALRAFAASLDDRFQIVDMRSPKPGTGFSWGRYGPKTELRRHGEERIFAYAKPPNKPGLLSQLFKSG